MRKKIFGTLDRPRMTVFRSNKNIFVQIINDEKSTSLVSSSSLEKELKEKNITNKEKSALVGEIIAKKAK